MKKFFFMLVCLWGAMEMMAQTVLPEPKREFRGSWIQCINGQFQGLGRDAMQAKLRQHLDAMQACGLNAVIFQVRGEADALYRSNIEPWSRFLTGQQGLAPTPEWDPLEWMVGECRARGMEIHAWINPYRAKTSGTKELAATHPYVLHPERFFKYGDLIIFNPALPENRQHICNVVKDIVSRYDVDGIHIDDYFYPYPQSGVEIPDQAFFQANPRGFADIKDWRRDNVNLLMRDLYTTIRTTKPWVKFGVSPFGIYHNARSGGNVPGSETGGLQNYDDLYADVLLWMEKGWVDYCMPQLYWEIGHRTADHETLVRWWSQQAKSRPIIVGQDINRTVKAVDTRNPEYNQLPAKMQLQRTLPGVVGSCLWYSAALAENTGHIQDALKQMYHTRPALQPLMPYIDMKAPKKVAGMKAIWTENGYMLVWLEPKATNVMDAAASYVVYRFEQGERVNLKDFSHLVAITRDNYIQLPYQDGSRKYKYVVTVLDRLQNESKAKTKTVKL